MSNLRVYSGTIDGQHRSIVAARNQATAAQILGCSFVCVRNYFSVTGNAEEIAVAMQSPGTVYRKPDMGREGAKAGWEVMPPRCPECNTPNVGESEDGTHHRCRNCGHRWEKGETP